MQTSIKQTIIFIIFFHEKRSRWKRTLFLSYGVIRSSQCNHCRKGNSFLL